MAGSGFPTMFVKRLSDLFTANKLYMSSVCMGYQHNTLLLARIFCKPNIQLLFRINFNVFEFRKTHWLNVTY